MTLWVGAACAVEPESFHAPSMPAETALDHILQVADNDNDAGNLFDYILHRPGYKSIKDDGYSALFTPAFIQQMSGEEARLVRQDCGGRYIDGESCGFDYNPVTCAQDSLPAHLYATVRSSPAAAVVVLGFAPQDNAYASYTLANEGDHWRLNDVQCLTAEE